MMPDAAPQRDRLHCATPVPPARSNPSAALPCTDSRRCLTPSSVARPRPAMPLQPYYYSFPTGTPLSRTAPAHRAETVSLVTVLVTVRI